MHHYMRLLMSSLLISAAAPVLSQQRDSYVHGHMWGGGGWFMGPIFMLLFLAVIVGMVLFLIKHAGGSNHSTQITSSNQKDTPQDLLKFRYAKGEIDHDEYELRRKTLES